MKKITSPIGYSWCSICRQHLDISNFHRGSRYNGFHSFCKSCDSIRRDVWNKDHSEHVKIYNDNYVRSLKNEVIFNYGGKCICCGENKFEFLTIDHISENGNKHRKEIGQSSIYQWLKRNGYPQNRFQLLCMNCNFAKGKYGSCPHKMEMLKAI